MSLQVWLPLNGNLENQGVQNVTVTNNGAVVNSNGKIGSCYQFGTNASDIQLPKETMTNFTTACSVTFWIKILSWNSTWATFFQAGLSGTPWVNYTFGFLRNGSSSKCCFTISDGSSASNANYQTSDLDQNVWYHVSLIYTTGQCLIYLNGALENSYSTSIVPNFNSINSIRIGRCNNGSSYQTNCLMNDFRIYDHALSVKEVRELAKGLVLHYKFDDPYVEGATNYLTAAGSCPNLRNYTVATYATSIDGTCAIGNYVITYSMYINNTSSAPLGARCSPLLVAGGYDTFQGNRISPGMQGWSSVTCNLTDSSKYTGSFYPYVQNGASGSVPTESNFQVWHAQAERNDHQTAWTRGGTTRAGGPCVYDSSGYGYNGTLTSSRVLKIASDSPRYALSTMFPRYGENGQCVDMTDTTLLPAITSGTVSWWVKYTSTQNLLLTGNNDIHYYLAASQNNAYYNSRITVGTWYVDGLPVSSAPKPVTGAWHMYTVTGVDFTGWTTFRLNRYDGSNAWSLNGSLSDFRIYATSLSAADVLELYHTEAAVGRSGEVFAREVIER